MFPYIAWNSNTFSLQKNAMQWRVISGTFSNIFFDLKFTLKPVEKFAKIVKNCWKSIKVLK
jgi:hypothetical protein